MKLYYVNSDHNLNVCNIPYKSGFNCELLYLLIANCEFFYVSQLIDSQI